MIIIYFHRFSNFNIIGFYFSFTDMIMVSQSEMWLIISFVLLT